MEGTSMLSESIEIGFCVDRYRRFEELPLEVVNNLPFSVYILDYNWVYLFINRNTRDIFGEEVGNLLGKSALEVFKDAKFKPIFDKIQHSLDNKTICNATIYSPLRGKQVTVKGFPLEDCYYFYTVVLPSKAELMDELREELHRKRDEF